MENSRKAVTLLVAASLVLSSGVQVIPMLRKAMSRIGVLPATGVVLMGAMGYSIYDAHNMFERYHAQLAAKERFDVNTPLRVYVQEDRSYGEITEFLQDPQVMIYAAAHINEPDSQGLTALHYAVMHGRDDLVCMLLRFFPMIDPNCQSSMVNTTPLHFALQGFAEYNPHLRQAMKNCIQSLVQHGAIDLEVKNAVGLTPYVWAWVLQQEGYEHMNEVVKMLKDRQESAGTYFPKELSADYFASLTLPDFQFLPSLRDINQRYEPCGATLLHMAAGLGNIAYVQFLLKHFPNIRVHVFDNQNLTPEDWVIRMNPHNALVIKQLLESK